jgi:hypothetical protein
MNDVYAIEPAALATRECLNWVRHAFAPGMGRFIANIPFCWAKDVVQGFSSEALGGVTGDVLRMRAEELIRIAPILPVNVSSIPATKNWVDSVRALASCRSVTEEVYKVLGASEIKPDVQSLDAAMYDVDIWRDASASIVRRSVVDYERVVDPIFRICGRVSVIDNYLSVVRKSQSGRVAYYNGYKASLDMFFRLAVKYRRTRLISFYVGKQGLLSNGRGRSSFLGDYLAEVADRYGLGHDCFEVVDLDAVGGNHQRVIIGQTVSAGSDWAGGILFDHGFDIASGISGTLTQAVAWLSPELLGNYRARFL